MKAFEYVDVKTPESAAAALPADASMNEPRRSVYLKAGGIDLIDMLKERDIEPNRLLNLKAGEADLRYIRLDGDTIRIGPLVTLHQLSADPIVVEHFPGLAQAAGEAATPQIRNVATVGGNLCQRPRCWYFRAAEFNCLKKGGDICFAKEGENQYHAVFGDGPSYIVHPSNLAVPLTAVDAEIEVRNPEGTRVIRTSEFFVMPDENVMVENVLGPTDVIAELRIPTGIKQSSYYEVREKQSYDWPLVAATAALTSEGWRVVMGAVAPVPWRASETEEILGSKPMTAELAAEAAEAAVAGAKPLRYNRYKLDLIKVVVRRALTRAAGLEDYA